MVHELLCLVDDLAADRPLVLLLEDLHWSDHATVGALAALATPRTPAHLMIVASYRQADAIAHSHPVTRFKHELASKRQCLEIALEGLDPEAVAAYLSRRFPSHRFPTDLSALLYKQTSGNPLFLLNALDDFVQRRWLEERAGAWECSVDLATLAGAVPDGTREMIAFRLQQLSTADHDLLEGASVIGAGFATQALAAVLERPPADVEVDCTRLARTGQFLGEGQSTAWPDVSAGMHVAFRHALYQQVLYARVTPGRRQVLHLRVAQCLEKGFAEEANTIAPQLAHHFERDGDLQRAVRYHREAAHQALSRYAYEQAITHSESAFDALRRMPAGAERDAQELGVRVGLLPPISALFRINSPELSQAIERIRPLLSPAPTTPETLFVFGTLIAHSITIGELHTARVTAQEVLARAAARADGGGIVATVARGMLGLCEVFLGELEAGVPNCESAMHLPDLTSLSGATADPGLIAAFSAALGHCLLGRPAYARELIAAAVRRAEATTHPPTILHVSLGAIRIGLMLPDSSLVVESAARMASLAPADGPSPGRASLPAPLPRSCSAPDWAAVGGARAVTSP